MENFSRRFGITLNVILAVVCGIWAFNAIRHLQFITAVIALGFVLTWLLIATQLARSKNAAIDAKLNDLGTVLRPDSRVEASQRRSNAALALSGLSMVIAWMCGWLYLPLPEGVGQIFPIAFGATGLVAGWFWFVFKRQGGTSYMLLTAEKFKFVNLGCLNSGEWDDIASVTDKLPTEERFWPPMVITMQDGSILTMDSPGSYTPKGTALIELMRFYWHHPEKRDELTDGRALDRIHAMQTGGSPNAKR
ncbi:hypothetical protein BVU76_23320 [Mycolicibacterium porcinum]|nr:hypothetical protein BVU76_23320 [Mycolicibacterium porcinum]